MTKAKADTFVFGTDHDIGEWSHPFYLVMGIIASLLLFLQLYKLRRLRVLTSYVLLPLLSVIIKRVKRVNSIKPVRSEF